MNEIHRFLENIDIPLVTKVKQRFNDTQLTSCEEVLFSQLNGCVRNVRKGDRIAITAGSRGIDKYIPLMRTIVDFVKSKECVPFIVPAMGSHGGSTAEGQEDVLRHLGITEQNVGAPVISSTEVVQLGVTNARLPVFIDKHAYNADGIILFNRVKPHTAFRGRFESGLLKMLAIGLAKPKGAQMTHFLRLENMPQNIISVGTIALAKLPIVCGIATIENSYSRLAEIHVLKKNEIMDVEPDLLERAWKLMPRIYIKKVDVMVVREIGKEISGSGMDSNIIGRGPADTAAGGVDSTLMGLLDVTECSNGNANGMGFADFTTKKLFQKIDFISTYMNNLTSTQPKGTKIPMILDTDKMVFQACIRCCGQVDLGEVRLVIIKNTKEIDEIYMSRAAVEDITCVEMADASGEYHVVPFDCEGSLALFE